MKNTKTLELAGGLGLAGVIVAGAAWFYKSRMEGSTPATPAPAVAAEPSAGVSFGVRYPGFGTAPANPNPVFGIGYRNYFPQFGNVTTAGNAGPVGSTTTGGTAETAPAFGIRYPAYPGGN